jgi:hypothetical protein
MQMRQGIKVLESFFPDRFICFSNAAPRTIVPNSGGRTAGAYSRLANGTSPIDNPLAFD